MGNSVLVIEDNAIILKEISLLLEEEGYEVTEKGSGEAALPLLDEMVFDIVISDLVMAGICGLEILKKIRKKGLNTAVIIVTAFGEIDTAICAMRNGADDYISKPFDREDLIARVKKGLANNELKGKYSRIERKYQGIVENLNDAIAATNAEGKIEYISPPICKILGYSPEELIGRSYDDFLDPADYPPSQAETSNLFQSSFSSGIRRMRAKDGRGVWVRFSSDTHFGKNGTVYSVLTDVTEMISLHEDLVENVRLEAAGELAAFVAHDVNSPLQGILAMLDYLKKKKNSDEELCGKLSLMYEGLIKIKSTVKGLLEIGSPGNGKYTDINIAILKMLKLSERQLQDRGIKVISKLAQDLPLANISYGDFEHILFELFRGREAPKKGTYGSRIMERGRDLKHEETNRVSLVDLLPPYAFSRKVEWELTTKCNGNHVSILISERKGPFSRLMEGYQNLNRHFPVIAGIIKKNKCSINLTRFDDVKVILAIRIPLSNRRI